MCEWVGMRVCECVSGWVCECVSVGEFHLIVCVCVCVCSEIKSYTIHCRYVST